MIIDVLRQLVTNKCSGQAVDPILLGAIIHVESDWNPKAMKIEPNFTYLSKPQEHAMRNQIDSATERYLQRFSYGLGQIMGGTCRDLGFVGMLTDLLDPSLNIDYMILYFKKYCSEYIYVTDKIAAYNAGKVTKIATGEYINQAYVDRVVAALDSNQVSTKGQTVLPETNVQH